MPASEDLLTAFRAFYTETLRPDFEAIVKSSEERIGRQLRAEMGDVSDGLRGEIHGTAEALRGEMREGEGRLRFEIREGDQGVREELQTSLKELRRDMNGHFDTVHQRLGHLEVEYRMLSVGLRRLEDTQGSGTSG
jgi:hypothetical protein